MFSIFSLIFLSWSPVVQPHILIIPQISLEPKKQHISPVFTTSTVLASGWDLMLCCAVLTWYLGVGVSLLSPTRNWWPLCHHTDLCFCTNPAIEGEVGPFFFFLSFYNGWGVMDRLETHYCWAKKKTLIKRIWMNIKPLSYKCGRAKA